jgi:hypothetical protein
MLLDILNNSLLLKNIILCVTLPGRDLIIVCYLVVATTIIYAQFGLQHYEHSFYASGTEGEDHCNSATSCFWLIMFKAAPEGKLSSIIAKTDNRGVNGGPSFILRIFFDLSFFIWVGVLLFNIITGITYTYIFMVLVFSFLVFVFCFFNICMPHFSHPQPV